ncbi:MAG: CapA family protein [bacterium]|nr:CapA family protein [bacterium]MCY3961429.1 CapA family protein [bacterium]
MLAGGCGDGGTAPAFISDPTPNTSTPVPAAAPTPVATLAPAVPPSAAPTPIAPPTATSTFAPTATPIPTASATPDPSAEPQSWHARLAFTGDLLSHGPVFRQAQANGGEDLAYDYRPMFELVQDTLSDADLAVCHLETPLSPNNRNLSGYPLFNAPGDLAVAIAHVGYDGCSTASNHSLDQGITGINDTLDLFDQAGLGHAGMARTALEGAIPRLYSVNGVTIGHLSYTYGLNGLILPDDKPWAVDINSVQDILGEARAAIELGAEFVVLSIHWGAEYQVAPTSQQRSLAKELLAGDEIDIIVGTHAHVIQPVERLGGNLVIYGLGNFLSNQSPQSCRSCPPESTDGVIVLVDLVEGETGALDVAAISAVPTWVDRRTFTIVDVGAALAAGTSSELTSQLEQSWARTTATLRSYGVDVMFAGLP